jgi:DNA-binding NarL/FixJ family response regulator
MSIRVAIALSNMLFAEGVRRFLDPDKDIEVVDVFKVRTGCEEKVRSSKPDIVLVDFLTLYNCFTSALPNGKTRFILLDTACGEENITSAVLSKGVSGVLPSNSSASSLKRAVKTVAGGELWLGKRLGSNLKKHAPPGRALRQPVPAFGRRTRAAQRPRRR